MRPVHADAVQALDPKSFGTLRHACAAQCQVVPPTARMYSAGYG